MKYLLNNFKKIFLSFRNLLQQISGIPLLFIELIKKGSPVKLRMTGGAYRVTGGAYRMTGGAYRVTGGAYRVTKRGKGPFGKLRACPALDAGVTVNGLFVGILIIAMPLMASAQVMSSTNYKIPFQALGGGGDYSSSTNYGIQDTLAELGVNATGEDATSTNYKACAGYQCLRESGFLTVSFAVSSSPCTASTTSSAPYNVPLGALDTSSVATAANHICVIVTANAGGGVVVGNWGANGALASSSVPGDTIPSNTATLVAGTAGFGLCVTNAANGFSATSPYNGSCDTSTNHAIGGIATVNQTILTATNPVTSAYGDILTKAAISTTTPAHDDYAETITLTVSGTY